MNGYAYGAPMTPAQRAAYNDGLQSGQTDRSLGRVSEYARVSFPSEPEYVRYYSAGYNRGLRKQ
jgi:hypothetical protein